MKTMNILIAAGLYVATIALIYDKKIAEVRTIPQTGQSV